MSDDEPRLPRGNSTVRAAFYNPTDAKPKIEEYLVDRDEGLPLSFQGYFVGQNSIDPDSRVGTQVKIFVTTGANIITAVHQWQRTDETERHRRRAAVHQTPEHALAWLIEDGNGKLGKASKEAWETACQTWPEFDGKDVERID